MKKIARQCTFIVVLILVLTLGAAAAYASTEESIQTVSTNTSLESTSYTCNGYDVMLGSVGMHAMQSDSLYTATYYYSDGYFAKSPSIYNEHLATFALTLSNSAQLYYTTRYVKTLLRDIGCTNIVVSKDYYQIEFAGTSAYILAQKKLFEGTSKETTLVFVIPRSGTPTEQQYENFEYGTTGDAKSYSNSAQIMCSAAKSYVSKYKIDTSTVKILTCGYSRAGALSNLLGQYLSDAFSKKQVYSYSYGAPRASSLSEKNAAAYTNVHVINNYNDISGVLAPSDDGWDIRHVGVVHYFADDTQSDFATKETKMLEYMQTMFPEFAEEYVSPSTFKWASLKLDITATNLVSIVSGLLNGNTESLFEVDDDQSQGSSLRECVEIAKDRILEKALPSRDSYTTTSVPKVVQEAATKLGATETYSFETAFVNCYREARGLTSEQQTKLENDLKNITTPLLKNASLATALLNYLKTGSTSSSTYKTFPELVAGLWKFFDTSSGSFVKISSIFTADQIKILKNSLPILLYTVAQYTSIDYGQEKQTLGSIIYNSSLLSKQHYCELAHAWLRVDDSYYASGVPSASFTDNPAIISLKAISGSSLENLSITVTDLEGATVAQVANGAVQSATTVDVTASSSAISISIPAFVGPSNYTIEVTAKKANTSFTLSRTCATDSDPSLIVLEDLTPISFANFTINTGKTMTIGAYSDIAYVDQAAATPKTVSGLKASSVTTSSVTLSWNSSSNYVTGYKVYKNGSLYKTLTGYTNTKCTVSSLGAGYSYYFKVVPYIGSTLYTSAKSATIYQPTKPVQAYVSKVTTGSSHYAKVTWTKRNCTGYLVQIAKNSKFTSGKVSAYVKSASTLSKTFTKLTKGKKYYVRVSAYKTYGGVTAYGAWSTIKTITIK